ncbi:MAG: zinc-binding dehydrogenase [Armatimonadetes bacterium]|nr:zinc-binding dehydrogenase [Armatimonadota bacterium]
MKAIVFYEHGDVDRLQLAEVETPEPARGEVLVQVRACALNHVDIWVRLGGGAYGPPLPHVLGGDVAGEIAILGNEVEGPPVGTRVVIAPGISCGNCSECLAGRDNRCSSAKILGAHVWGGYAEYVVVPARNVVPIHDSFSFVEAAAVPITFLTAWHLLVNRAAVRPGETVLVLGAGSGVGAAAIPIAKLAGARVIAASRTEVKRNQALQIGADEAVDSGGNFAETIMAITGGQGVDVVVEHVGPATFSQSVASLRRGGRLVTCGSTTGPTTEFTLRTLFGRELSLIGGMLGTRSEFATVMSLVAGGKLKPTIDRTFPLDEAADAQRRLLAQEQFGKIVLTA